jgi:hypothetical protein
VVALRCVGVFCATGAGEIPASLSGPDAVSPSGDTIPSWRALWEPLCTILYIPGETLGPVRSGQQRRFDGVLLPEGAAWYGTLRNAWSVVEKDGGCSDCGSSLFRHFAFVVISFFLGMFLLLPQHFFRFKLLYQCGCYINIAGRKPVSRIPGTGVDK